MVANGPKMTISFAIKSEPMQNFIYSFQQPVQRDWGGGRGWERSLDRHYYNVFTSMLHKCSIFHLRFSSFPFFFDDIVTQQQTTTTQDLKWMLQLL